MRVLGSAVLCAVGLFLLSGAAMAGDIIDEFRIGGSASLDSSNFKHQNATGSAEVFIAPFPSSGSGGASVLLEPRIQLGVSGGHKATDQVYAGLDWHVPLGETVFAEFGIGGTVHNGNLDSGRGPLLGCRLLFREHAALGLRVTETVNVLATIDHSSHADLCDGPNDGLTHAGLALGFKF